MQFEYVVPWKLMTLRYPIPSYPFLSAVIPSTPHRLLISRIKDPNRLSKASHLTGISSW